MNAKTRAELRADLIAFTRYLADAGLDGEALARATTAFLVREGSAPK